MNEGAESLIYYYRNTAVHYCLTLNEANGLMNECCKLARQRMQIPLQQVAADCVMRRLGIYYRSVFATVMIGTCLYLCQTRFDLFHKSRAQRASSGTRSALVCFSCVAPSRGD